MGVSEKNLAIVNAIKQSDLNSYKALRDLLDMAKVIADEEGDNDLGYAESIDSMLKEQGFKTTATDGMLILGYG